MSDQRQVRDELDGTRFELPDTSWDPNSGEFLTDVHIEQQPSDLFVTGNFRNGEGWMADRRANRRVSVGLNDGSNNTFRNSNFHRMGITKPVRLGFHL